ncbi:succinate dehydrogenase cytochrome b subunit [Xiashengella succiniciproducens]|jgi:succinate dehydrogenase / fumarate reductase cytochrome b subunit|uniref:Succinate dehydrogenase cytochrome b subunit n=1 Tax=Xiashengella succiniciproducens TaxID=2949635 RepID=A0A9J6ZQB4_9BACT|nr:succinate dehydrogenase cytochrome b subunit [Alkaliflexus sp. Ai-910]URW79702.1 succinate dehydrogenase cytochrome b subunit [Alkaliflexus sp. Ai-910]
MSSFLKSSIGKKLVMSISGLFLMMFLLIHLTVNAMLLIPDGGDTYNAAAHFMATNPLIKIVEPVLGIGFVIHIIWAFILTLENRRARGNVRYASGNATNDVAWASKNMLVLGITILAFLIIHLANFWVKMKLTGDPLLEHVTVNIGGVDTQVENAYALVNTAFSYLWIVVIYVIAGIGLALHLSHGFWSAFQTIGMSNQIWRKRLTVLGCAYAWVVGLGFSVIALVQYICY